jgi:hypothetical protein
MFVESESGFAVICLTQSRSSGVPSIRERAALDGIRKTYLADPAFCL